MQEKVHKISPIKQRILHYAKNTPLSMRDFYKKTGISRGTLESNTGITEDTITKVIVAFDNISPLWLLTGDGQMLRTMEADEVRPANEPSCRSCIDKDETIKALKDVISALRMNIDILTSEKSENKSGYKQTG